MLDGAPVAPPGWRRARDAAVQLYEGLPDTGKKSFCRAIFPRFLNK